LFQAAAAAAAAGHEYDVSFLKHEFFSRSPPASTRPRQRAGAWCVTPEDADRLRQLTGHLPEAAVGDGEDGDLVERSGGVQLGAVVAEGKVPRQSPPEPMIGINDRQAVGVREHRDVVVAVRAAGTGRRWRSAARLGSSPRVRRRVDAVCMTCSFPP
jgi:hypothetical protein